MHMTEESKDMKLLKTENGRGYFQTKDGNFESLDKLNKETLLRLVDLTLENENVEFDNYDEAVIYNQAHRIIYKSVYGKLTELAGRREEFAGESERVYRDAYEKYRDDGDRDQR